MSGINPCEVTFCFNDEKHVRRKDKGDNLFGQMHLVDVKPRCSNRVEGLVILVVLRGDSILIGSVSSIPSSDSGSDPVCFLMRGVAS